MQVFDAWILVGLELSASPSQQVFNRAEVFLPYALVLVKLRSAPCQQQYIITGEISSSTSQILESVIVCSAPVSCACRRHEAKIHHTAGFSFTARRH